MTEKRFTYEYNEYNGNMFDNKMNTFYPIEDSEENIEVFCDRLNWLVEENEQLKKENKHLRCTIESNSQDDYIDYLEKQNERLKERITELNYLTEKAMDNPVNHGRIKALKELKRCVE